MTHDSDGIVEGFSDAALGSHTQWQAWARAQRAEQAHLEQKYAEVAREYRTARASLQALQAQLARFQQGHTPEAELQALRQHNQALLAHVQAIEQSTVFRLSRPLVQAKMRLSRALGRAPVEELPPALLAPDAEIEGRPSDAAVHAEELPGQACAGERAEGLVTQSQMPETQGAAAFVGPIDLRAPGVDIIVPVYKGLADTQRCVQSVLASWHHHQTPMRLIVINDASPEPDLTQWLRGLAAQEHRVILLENSENLGFVATVNRGMAWPPAPGAQANDVLLLNSDTEVANDWLDRLRAAAYRSAQVGTVTPFSNTATICSYPRFCEANALPDGYTTATLDALCAQLNAAAHIDIPTAVGFCMYIRRDCLAQVGLFDVVHFGLGYGEENDFCQRALALGWRNVHALDTFVLHTGGVSFGARKAPREQAAWAILQQLHPGYAPAVEEFVRLDPARPYRNRLDMVRLRASARPRVLAVSHSVGGGTQRHVWELARHLQNQAIFLLLTPLADHCVRVQWLDEDEGFAQDFHWPTASDQLVALLRALGVCHVHYHHFLGLDTQVMYLHERLGGPQGVSYDFTVHDYYSACPQISLTTAQKTYCGERGVSQCTACLQERPAATQETIDDWRLRHRVFLHQARYVLTPSVDAAVRMQRYFPQAPIRCVPHTDMLGCQNAPAAPPYTLPAQEHLRVFIVGGLSEIKGGDVAQATAVLAAEQGAPLEFHLLGIPYVPFKTQPQASLTIHGAYHDPELQLLLERLQPHVVWFPAQWPETYSYTISACLKAGVPVVATNLGSFVERLAQRPWTWLAPWDYEPAQWLALFLRLREQHFLTGHPPPPVDFPPAMSPYAAAPAWSYASDYLDFSSPSLS